MTRMLELRTFLDFFSISWCHLQRLQLYVVLFLDLQSCLLALRPDYG